MANNFIAEFSKRPPQYKAMVFGVIGVVMALGYYKFGWSPLNEKLEAAQSENAQLIDRSKRMDADLEAFKDLQLTMKELQKKIDENEKALPSESELPAFFETLGRKVTESGVEVNRWDFKKEEAVNDFFRVPIDVEITGTFYQIKRFFASLVQRDVQPTAMAGGEGDVQERERIVSIENLAISNPRVRNRQIVMTAKFVASTFRQEDANAKAAKSAPAKSPATPAAAAGTPAGAKAQTEGALKTQDTKTREGAAMPAASATSDGMKGGK